MTGRRSLLRRTHGASGCIAALMLACAGAASAMTPGAYTIQSSERHAVRVTILTHGLEHPWSLAFLPDGRMLVTERTGPVALRRSGRDARSEPDRRASRGGGASGAGRAARCRAPPGFSRATASSTSPTPAQATGATAPSLPAAGSMATGSPTWKSVPGAAEVRRRPPLRRARGVRRRGARVPHPRRPRRPAARAGSRRSRRLRHSPRRRRRRAPGQSVRLGGGREARDLLAGQSQRAGRGHEPLDGRALDSRARPAGRRRGQRHPLRNQLRLAGHHLRKELRHRHVDRRSTHRDDVAQPLHQWTPSIAPSGMAFYDGDKFPEWRASLLVGALKFRLLVRLEHDGERVVHEERMLEDVLGRIRGRAGRPGRAGLPAERSSERGDRPPLARGRLIRAVSRCLISVQDVFQPPREFDSMKRRQFIAVSSLALAVPGTLWPARWAGRVRPGGIRPASGGRKAGAARFLHHVVRHLSSTRTHRACAHRR